MAARREETEGGCSRRGHALLAPWELRIDKARGLEVEDFGGGVVGFRLPEEGGGGEAVEAEAPAKAPRPRRRAAAD